MRPNATACTSEKINSIIVSKRLVRVSHQPRSCMMSGSQVFIVLLIIEYTKNNPRAISTGIKTALGFRRLVIARKMPTSQTK